MILDQAKPHAPAPPSPEAPQTQQNAADSSVSQVETEKSEIPSITGETKTVPLPKFLIIGSTKCSTSALLRFLQLHPRLRSPGETYYFNKHFEEKG